MLNITFFANIPSIFWKREAALQTTHAVTRVTHATETLVLFDLEPPLRWRQRGVQHSVTVKSFSRKYTVLFRQ